MKMCTDYGAKQYMDEAERWLGTTNGLWGSVKSSAKSAVAEYLANQDGFTLYEGRADKSHVNVGIQINANRFNQYSDGEIYCYVKSWPKFMRECEVYAGTELYEDFCDAVIRYWSE